MNNITIEKTDPSQGYIRKDYSIDDAYQMLNDEIDNGQTIFIDGKPFLGDIIQKEDISKCKKEISVTPRLSGG
jgi:hypothetical protein